MLTWVEIDQKAVHHNIEQFKKICKGAQIWPVIKSNAYGHGFFEIAKIIDHDTYAKGFVVASLIEALRLAEYTEKQIMVVSYFDPENSDLIKAAGDQIILPIFDLYYANKLNDIAKQINKTFQVIIKVNTGTNRLGFHPETAEEAIKEIEQMKGLKIHSIYSHFAESEGRDLDFTQKQYNAVEKLAGKKKYKMHVACSASTICLPESQADLVRIGASTYGLWSSDVTRKRGEDQGMELKPALSFKTKIIQVLNVKKGATIGYNRTYTCEKDCQIVTIPVGYNEGYDRSLSNKSEVLINGNRYPVRGNICMNMTMVEVPKEDSVSIGDEVTLIGRQRKEEILADELAKLAETINYEIVTRINPKIKRIVV